MPCDATSYSLLIRGLGVRSPGGPRLTCRDAVRFVVTLASLIDSISRHASCHGSMDRSRRFTLVAKSDVGPALDRRVCRSAINDTAARRRRWPRGCRWQLGRLAIPVRGGWRKHHPRTTAATPAGRPVPRRVQDRSPPAKNVSSIPGRSTRHGRESPGLTRIFRGLRVGDRDRSGTVFAG